MVSDFFSNGSVYVIDDQANEAAPLIKALYKHQVPHIYLDGSAAGLPKSPKQVRVILLDLNLKPGTATQDAKSFKSIHAGILSKLLANEASSYIVLVWSKEEATYRKYFEEIFNEKTDLYGFNNRPPLDIISLEKGDYFQSSVGESGEIIFDWKEGKEDQLFAILGEKLSNNEAFRILCSWETVIANSGANTVDYLFELVRGLKQPQLNQQLNQLVSSLSISYLGKENFEVITSNQERTDAFMLALSELIDDEIDRKIILKSQPEFEGWNVGRLKPDDRSKLNGKLLTSVETEKSTITGSVFEGGADHDFVQMLVDCLDVDRTKFKTKKESTEKGLGRPCTKEEVVELKVAVAKEISSDAKRFVAVEVNLTPLCDVVQKKEVYYRIVPGFIIDVKSSEWLFKSTDRNYCSPLLRLDESMGNCHLVLDYRYLHSEGKEKIEKRKKLFRLRKGFVDDIQLKLANHVSRLGMLYLG